jgi:hypothetical protein
MSPKQKKLAAKAPPPNKIDAKDFAVLKAEKAKGRGMGLQDEKIKPGKVMKANKGKMFDGYLSTFDASAEASTPKSQRGVTTIVGVKPGAEIGKGKKRFTSMEAMRTAKGFRTIDGKQETSSQFNKRRMALAAAKKAAKASTFGKIALGVGAAGVAAQQYLKSKMNKKDEPKKKMGGGMMNKPMGYKSGNTVRKDIKLGRALVEAFGSKKTINKMKANIQDQNRVKKYSIGTGPLGATKKRLQQGPSPSKQPSPDKPLGLAALPSSDTELKNTINQVKAKYASLKETARDELTPMKSDRVFSKFRRPDSAKEFYADKSGSKYEGMAKDAMQNRINYHKNKKMAGGMAKKYSKGGDLRAEYIHSQTKKNRKVTGEGYFTERSATRREEYGAAKDRYPNKMDRRKQMLKNLSRVLNPTMGVVKGTIDALNAPTTRKYSVGGGADIGAEKKSMKDTDIPTRRSRSPQNLISNKEMRIKSLRQSATPGYLPKPAIGKMGGGMMQRPMGYKSGTMVKARGCKLGRTRPTKMY